MVEEQRRKKSEERNATQREEWEVGGGSRSCYDSSQVKIAKESHGGGA